MPVTLTKSGAIAVVSIDNPPVNALNTAIRAQLLALVEATEADAAISAVVLIGAGKLFVGGADAATPVEDFHALDARLTERGVDHEMYVYDGAPHSFFDRAFAEWKDACADAWQRMLAFTARLS